MADESVAIRGFPSEPPNDTTRYSALKKGEKSCWKGDARPCGKVRAQIQRKVGKDLNEGHRKGIHHNDFLRAKHEI